MKNKKTIINLYEKVVTLEEFKVLYNKNILPLIVVLNKEELRSNLNYINYIEDEYISIINNIYSDTKELNNEFSNIYMILNIEKLEKDYVDKKININNFIDKNENISTFISLFNQFKIDYNNHPQYYHHSFELAIEVCYGKGLIALLRKNNYKEFYLIDLILELGKEHIKEQRKNTVLSQQQIDDIHSRGKITPQEKAIEWSKSDICAPGSGKEDNRCKKFNNCDECLLDYACYKKEYDKLFDSLKVTNSIDSSKILLKKFQ